MRKKYTLAFKLKVIKHFEKNGKNLAETSRAYIVDRKTIRSWIAGKEAIIQTNLKRTRAKVNRRISQAENPELEQKVFNWIKQVRSIGGCVSGKMIRNKAVEISKNSEFVASNGWLVRFLKRHRLSLRRVTTKSRKPPNNSIDIIKTFLGDNQMLHGIDRSTIFNMDETSVYLDFPSNYTYDQIGSQTVPSYTTGNTKTRLSAAFCASSNGWIIFFIPSETFSFR